VPVRFRRWVLSLGEIQGFFVFGSAVRSDGDRGETGYKALYELSGLVVFVEY